jgi:hypothetical protein
MLRKPLPDSVALVFHREELVAAAWAYDNRNPRGLFGRRQEWDKGRQIDVGDHCVPGRIVVLPTHLNGRVPTFRAWRVTVPESDDGGQFGERRIGRRLDVDLGLGTGRRR